MRLVPLAATALVLLPFALLAPSASADDVCEGPVCVPTPCLDPVVGCLGAWCREHLASCNLYCLYGDPCFRP
jgi:hypothetical protein